MNVNSEGPDFLNIDLVGRQNLWKALVVVILRKDLFCEPKGLIEAKENMDELSTWVLDCLPEILAPL